jgi:PAS domain S-box-containing protein
MLDVMSAKAERQAPAPLRGEARDQLLARVAFEATWERDLDSQAMSWDGSVESIFGYDRGEVVGHLSWWRERVHPEDLERAEQTAIEAVRSGRYNWSNEYRFRRKDGSWAWVAARGAIERDGEGRAVRAVGAMIDISTLKETEARLRLFTDQIPARATATDRELRVVWDAGSGFPGSPSPLGKTVGELFGDSPDRERVLEGCAKALAGESCKLQIDNGEAAAQLQIGPVRDLAGKVIGVTGVAFDVTERARAESALREAQRILLAAQRVGKVRAWEEDLRTGMVKLDPVGPATVPGAAQFELRTKEEAWKEIHPGDFPRLMEIRRRIIEEGLPFETEYRLVRPDGTERNILVRGELMRNAAGLPERIIGVSLDVTDRVRRDEEVRASQRLLHRVLDTLPVGVVVVDRAGDAILSNPASSRIWGGVIVSGPERWAKSKGWWHDSGKPIGHGEWASERALAKGETSLDELIDIETYDGRRVTIENSAAPIRDAQGSIVGAVVVNEDVTESRRAEEEVARRARQQAAVAQLSLSALRSDERQPLLDEAAALVASTLQIDHAMVLESLPDRSELVFRAIAGSWKPEVGPRVTVRTEPGLMGWFSLRAAAPVVVEDLAAETRFVPCDLLRAQGVRSGINVPIPGKERAFGILGAHSTRQRTFTADEVSFVWSVANVLATFIEQRRAAGELREKREQLQALSRKLIGAQEAERRAVARELHDDLGQLLTALRMNLQKQGSNLAENIGLVDQALGRTRELAIDLRPSILDDLGLAAALRWYLAREAKRAGLDYALEADELPRQPPALETTCFRLVQEAITNVARHARARKVEVSLALNGGALSLSIRDDGQGFDVAEAYHRTAAGQSQGLLGMQERASLAGGELAIESGRGGTSIRARFPLSRGG